MSNVCRIKINGCLNSASHPCPFFRTAAACLLASLAMVSIMPFRFLSTSTVDVSAEAAKLFCKLTIHRNQCCRCPINGGALPVDLSTA